MRTGFSFSTMDERTGVYCFFFLVLWWSSSSVDDWWWRRVPQTSRKRTLKKKKVLYYLFLFFPVSFKKKKSRCCRGCRKTRAVRGVFELKSGSVAYSVSTGACRWKVLSLIVSLVIFVRSPVILAKSWPLTCPLIRFTSLPSTFASFQSVGRIGESLPDRRKNSCADYWYYRQGPLSFFARALLLLLLLSLPYYISLCGVYTHHTRAGCLYKEAKERKHFCLFFSSFSWTRKTRRPSVYAISGYYFAQIVWRFVFILVLSRTRYTTANLEIVFFSFSCQNGTPSCCYFESFATLLFLSVCLRI
jgi:hypothetical protein